MTKQNFKLALLSAKEKTQNLELKTEDVKLVSTIIDIGNNLKETLIAIPPDYLVLAISAILALIVICLTVGFMYYQHIHNKSSPLMREKRKHEDKRKRRKKYHKKRR